ncbi:MAG: hypothetical protein ACE5I1_17030, partial [bacterium]
GFHDQVLDIDRGIKINHTGRLSGTLVKFLFDHCTCNFYSEIKVTTTDVTDNTAPSIILDTRCDQIVPQPQAKNVWFFKDPATKDELLFTLDTEVAKAADANLQAEHVYKLIINWRFWTACEPPRKRLPISGYDESISFEVITETENI